ncbi:PLP-dependent transferase [Rhizobium mongolense]|uniref:Seryl-tRNA(Sec) selenium transferase n=2 Tax=Rhizobium mongolense TaxID=57676 RepID=A0ABR6IXC7_9HYPH|nr:PLP-dependent transferase [Rhizobium mongolense]MBB4232516.1 seryl-tRNA(Sec) selenium transferase [Rhizobium mongolense]TVZ75042.1 seryl-tRNA(Sec) selenium transferase [Rhizobium mongolense USDA 1844]
MSVRTIISPLGDERSAPAARTPGWIYRELGVEPIINCTGVRTSYGGCNQTAEVLAAMIAASEAFVDVDELQEAIGHRLSRLTGAEWGVVTAGSVAALSLAVAACLVGNNPEKMLLLPHDFGKTVLVADDQRMPYEHAIRAVGCSVTPIKASSEIEKYSTESAAAICLVGHDLGISTLSFEETADFANRQGIPLIVDAAGLAPRFPNEWLAGGADLIVHSGGKYIRGPQSTGFLIGNEALCRAAFLNGPPHQSFGRSMKVGKDEMVAAYVALERWVQDQELTSRMLNWRECIKAMIEQFRLSPLVETEILEPDGAFCNPRLAISWADLDYLPTAYLLANRLSKSRPRIVLHDYWLRPRRIIVDPTNLSIEEARIVADSILTSLSDPPDGHGRPPEEPSVNVGGTWDLTISFLYGASQHRWGLEQLGNDITGRHVGDLSSGPSRGRILGPVVSLTSELAGDPMTRHYAFEGTVCGNTMSGSVCLGAATAKHAGSTFKRQFGAATWTAVRRSSEQERE